MFQKLKTILFHSLPVIIIATLVVTAIIYAQSKSTPTTLPPGGNVPAPINVGTSTQTFLGSKRLTGNTSADVLGLGLGLGVDGVFRAYTNAIFDGNVGIGTTAPSKKLTVDGDIEVFGSGNLVGLTVGQLSVGGRSFEVSFKWRGDGNHPNCPGSIYVSKDNQNWTKIVDNKSAYDTQKVKVNIPFKYLKTEFPSSGYCGWVFLYEIEVKTQTAKSIRDLNGYGEPACIGFCPWSPKNAIDGNFDTAYYPSASEADVLIEYYDLVGEGDLTVAGNLKLDGTNSGIIFPDGTKQITAADAAAGGSTFTRWGNSDCPAGTEKLYDGFGFNEHYTQSGGGAEPICVKSGDPGAQGPGNDYGDLLYPLGTGSPQSQIPPGIGVRKEIKCAVCYANGPNFELWGSWSCPTNWKPAYVGYGMGTAQTHVHQTNRHCVDSINFDNSVANSNWGEIWYGTVLWANTDLPNKDTNYPTNKFVKCALCAKSDNIVPPTIPNYLVNLRHTYSDCTSAGGTVVDDGAGNKMCKFVASSCPTNWVQYLNWSRTTPRWYSTGWAWWWHEGEAIPKKDNDDPNISNCIAWTGAWGSFCHAGYSSWHSWQNKAREQQAFRMTKNCGHVCSSFNSNDEVTINNFVPCLYSCEEKETGWSYVYADIREIGCY